MGKYFNPPNELSSVGREIDVTTVNFKTLSRELRQGEYLVGCYDRVARIVCPLLTSQKDLDEFERQYSMGMFITRRFYAIDQNAYDAHIDKH